MEYLVSLFSDKGKAEQAAAALRQRGVGEADYDIKSHGEYAGTLKGLLERIFQMPEPLSGMEAEGLPHDDARWYEEQLEQGQTLLVARAGHDAPGVIKALEQAGGHAIRRYQKREEAWTQLSGSQGG